MLGTQLMLKSYTKIINEVILGQIPPEFHGKTVPSLSQDKAYYSAKTDFFLKAIRAWICLHLHDFYLGLTPLVSVLPVQFTVKSGFVGILFLGDRLLRKSLQSWVFVTPRQCKMGQSFGF